MKAHWRSLRHLSWVLLVACILSSVPIVSPLAAELRKLFKPAELRLSMQADQKVIRSRPAYVDFDLLTTMEPGSELDLNLMNDLSMTGLVEGIEKRSENKFTVTGSFPNWPYSSFIVVVEEDVAAATIRIPTQNLLFDLQYMGNGIHLIREIDSSLYPPEAPSVPGKKNPEASPPRQSIPKD